MDEEKLSLDSVVPRAMSIRDLDEKCKLFGRRIVVDYSSGVCKGFVRDIR